MAAPVELAIDHIAVVPDEEGPWHGQVNSEARHMSPSLSSAARRDVHQLSQLPDES